MDRVKAQKLDDLPIEHIVRYSTGFKSVDRVLGGGIAKGSLLLLGGDPGIGKSTLLTQMASNISNHGLKILYVCGEEALAQVKMRTVRLGINVSNVYVVGVSSIEAIENCIQGVNPDLLIIDSIQTMYKEGKRSSSGSITQVKEAVLALMDIAKDKGLTTICVGQVTKGGKVSGPNMLEHMVDAVLYFKGEKTCKIRYLSAIKNRFGDTSVKGKMMMTNKGLRDGSGYSGSKKGNPITFILRLLGVMVGCLFLAESIIVSPGFMIPMGLIFIFLSIFIGKR